MSLHDALSIYTENEREKMVIYMPLPMDLIIEMAEDQETSENYGIEKTGNTKTINGYRCEEYIIKDDHIVQHIWTTRDVKMSSNYYSVMKNMAQSNKKLGEIPEDRKSTRLNSSHVAISYAVFCLKKTTKKHHE